jgi:hypothetical protein
LRFLKKWQRAAVSNLCFQNAALNASQSVFVSKSISNLRDKYQGKGGYVKEKEKGITI